MTESKHTPGEWMVASSTTVYALNADGFNRFSCQVQDAHTARVELEANARLIAAAPELLVACKSVIAVHAEWIESMTGLRIAGESSCIQICRTAIAKATGEQA